MSDKENKIGSILFHIRQTIIMFRDQTNALIHISNKKKILSEIEVVRQILPI